MAELTVTVSEGRGVSEDAQAIATVSDDAASRLDVLNGRIGELELAIACADARGAQEATKAALEALHELGHDPLECGEWSQDAWSAGERELMTALAGARNAAHHGSRAVVALHVRTDGRSHLRWIVTLPPIDSNAQSQAYSRRLSNRAVLPALRSMAERVAASL